MISNRRLSPGFTLIELVTTLVLIGVLAAVALPKFFDNSEAAHLAVVNNVAGTLRSSIKIAQANWRVSSEQRTNLAHIGDNVSSNFINMVDYSQYGCPVQHWQYNSETDPSANNGADCLTVFVFLLDKCSNGATNCDYVPDTEFLPFYLGTGVCEYRYRHNTDYRIIYDTRSPSCTVSTIGF